MAKIKVKPVDSKEEWEKFVLSHDPKSFLQSWNWGEVNKQMKSGIFRLGVYQDNRLEGVCLIIKQEAKRGTHMIIPGGPIIDWENRMLTEALFEEIKHIARNEKAWFVRLRPELLSNEANEKLIKSAGLIKAPMHLHAENTWVLDIDKPDDQLLGEMRKNTRYSIKKSLEQGFKLQKTSKPKQAKMIHRLQEETVKRQRFVGFSEKFFRSQLESFLEDKQISLFFCKKGDKVVAASMVIYYGDFAYYHHSGTTKEGLRLGASYFLQWRIIQEAKDRGCKFYNFWGIAPEGSKSHRFSGVTTFKTGFGGERVDWIGAQDLPISRCYWLTHGFERLRAIFRGL